MTLDTLLFLQNVLASLTLSVGAPDFEEAAAKVILARHELAAAIEAAQAETSS